MKTAFRESLIAHVEKHGTKVVDLVKATGVSRSKINKLLRRENDKIELEDAISISVFYDKTVTSFLLGADFEPKSKIVELAVQLYPEEEDFLSSQIKGVIAHRKTREVKPKLDGPEQN